ncbi:MAG: AraC family transcriptional regulator [Anaerolineales bacterium]|nr:MAG: AraC family transcriptional regulator [Anaerolineales bacterium]
MFALDVRIEKLGPMTVASSHAIGKSPELKAWEQLRAWAEPKGFLDNLNRHPVFGFNNPGPTEGNEEYGYEFWIAIEPDSKLEGIIQSKQFPGGIYAVMRCLLMGDPGVHQSWKLLWEWAQSKDYRWGKSHGLEKFINPLASVDDIELELYLPIESAGA